MFINFFQPDASQYISNAATADQQLRLEAEEKLPAQKTGVRYETTRSKGFVEASPSRAFRDGGGQVCLKLGKFKLNR